MRLQIRSVPFSFVSAILRSLALRRSLPLPRNSFSLALGTFLLGLAACGSFAKASQIETDSIAILGETPNQEVTYLPLSARLGASPSPGAISADGDSFKAAGFAYTPTAAEFLDDFPDEHMFGTGEESAGTNLLSGVDMRIIAADLGPVGAGDHFIQVNYFTADSSPLVPAGAGFFTDWSLEVGTDFDGGGVNWIDFLPQNGFDILESGFIILNNGISLGSFGLDETVVLPENSLGGAGAVGLGGTNIAGFAADEIIMFWDIQETVPVPEPSSGLLLLLAGVSLVAAGRRRRDA